MIDIKGLDPVEVFRQLYNNSKPLGLGVLHYVPGDMSYKEADVIYHAEKGDASAAFFDYVKGRVMKVSIDSECVYRDDLYDRDVGKGECQRVVDKCIEEL